MAQKKKDQKKRAKEEKKRKSVSENSTAPSSKRAGTGEIEEVSLEQIPLPSPPPAIKEGTDPSKSYIAEIVEYRSAAQALQGAVPKLPTYIHEVPKEKLLPVGRSNKHLFEKRVLYEADPGLATINAIFFLVLGNKTMGLSAWQINAFTTYFFLRVAFNIMDTSASETA